MIIRQITIHSTLDKPKTHGSNKELYPFMIYFELIPKTANEAISIEKRVRKLTKEKRAVLYFLSFKFCLNLFSMCF